MKVILGMNRKQEERNMKNFFLALPALAVAMSLSTSCQRESVPGQDTDSDSVFTITATIADGGTKVSYTENESTYALKPAWEAGDIIIGFDGAGGTYGFRACEINDGVASFTLITEGEYAGAVTERPVDGTGLYLVYAPGMKPSDIIGKSLTVSLADQSTDVIPALMMAGGTVSGGSLTLSFENKTAIVGIKDPSMASAGTAYSSITLSGEGLNTEVKFDLDGDDFRVTYQNPGEITKAVDFTSSDDKEVSGVTYIVSCPLSAPADLTFTADNGERFSKSARTMAAGRYYYMTPVFYPEIPDGALGGLFTVDENGTQVRFSRGNLYYDSALWCFEENQYDMDPTESSEYSEVHISHFYWTDKLEYGASLYYENTTSSSVDWGVPYCLTNELEAGTWRTLSGREWQYLFNLRSASTVNGTADARYSYARVKGVTGIIVFPDAYTHPSELSGKQPTNINSGPLFNVRDYTVDEWTLMESAGAVFLPAAGCREGSDVSWVGDGYYWASNRQQVIFAGSEPGVAGLSASNYAQSVRLVTTVR